MFDRRGTRDISKRGGRRAGAGRKPVHGKTNGPAHRRRALISGRHPVSVTMRFDDSIRKNLRAPRFFKRIRACLLAAKVAAKVGGGARLCHFSVQKNHIHLIVEPRAGARGTGVEKALANARGSPAQSAVLPHDSLSADSRSRKTKTPTLTTFKQRRIGCETQARRWRREHRSAAAFWP